MNMLIEQLIQLSPVPVEFTDTMSVFAGTYWSIEDCSDKPRIEIANDLTNSQKTTTLIHEIGHALCDNKSCECMKNPDHTKREIHANKFTLSRLMKYKLKEGLKEEMERITQQADGLTSHVYYTDAAQHVMKLKLWQKCLDYVK